MKTITKNILVIALVLGTLSSYANVNVNHPSKNKITNKGDMVYIYDSEGVLVFSDKMERNGDLRSMFDFSNLKNGVYTIEINKDFEISMHTFKIENHNIRFIEEAKKTIHKPVIRTEKSRVLISKLALDNNEMKVELYFGNQLIYSETLSDKSIINRVYKLDKTEIGDYTAVIKSNGRIYVENFKI
ncbi:T9SS type A sorting domain-containing protein [Winogradskyella ursingii]|uniref:T9SS type A sorting domain-containing protein n=1 Tax=Winogradskyella ursingii TaxID=2686079 RepID=UPI0015C81755|nr:T9SS type A sorting domain-containing protein [Winogradskyella ursingii]